MKTKKKILLFISALLILLGTVSFYGSGMKNVSAATYSYQGTYFDIYFIPDTGNGYANDYANGNYYDLKLTSNKYYGSGYFFIRQYPTNSKGSNIVNNYYSGGKVIGYGSKVSGTYYGYVDVLYSTTASSSLKSISECYFYYDSASTYLSVTVTPVSTTITPNVYLSTATSTNISNSSAYVNSLGDTIEVTSKSAIALNTSYTSNSYCFGAYKIIINGIDSGYSMSESFSVTTSALNKTYGMTANTSIDIDVYWLDGQVTTTTIGYDTRKPTILLTVTNGEIYSDSKWFIYYDALSGLDTCTVTRSDGYTGSYSWDGDEYHSWNCTDSGVYTVNLSDMAGNTNTYTFTIDKTAPTFSGIIDGASYNSAVSFMAADAITSVTSVTDNGTALTASSGTYTISTEGTHEIIATDEAGWTTTYTITIDKTGPTVSSITNGSVYNEAKSLSCTSISGIKSIALTYTDTDGISNSNTVADGYTCYSNGTYSAIITDNAGNSNTYSFTVDRSAPIIRGVVNNGSYAGEVSITIEDFTDTEVTLNGVGVENTFTVSEEGDYTIVATDKAGNSTTINFAITASTNTTGSTDGSAGETKASSGDNTSTDDSNTTSGDSEGNDITSVETEEEIQVGTVISIGNYEYKVTKLAENNTGAVTLTNAAAKTKTVKIPAKVTINGVSYKVTAIEKNTFKDNKDITTVIIGKNVKKIGAGAFAGCISLKKVTIGKGVKKIGKKAFYGCKKLKKIVIKSKKLKSIGKKAFAKGKASVTVTVPKAKKKAYKKMLKKSGISKNAVYKTK